MKTAVLIPCYNEEKTIEKVITDFQKVLKDADIYVYDNNSSDDTAKVAEQAGAIVRHEYSQGKGNVVRSMFREIEADVYIMVDGDDTYPAGFAKEFERLIVEKKADMVVGDRLSSTYFSENKRLFHNFGNVLVRWLINKLFKAKLNDIMTGARAFSRDFVKSFAVISKGFEIETEMTVFALDNNMKIIERTVEYKDRPKGSESKLNTYSDGAKVLSTIAKLFRDVRPFAFFSYISLILFIVGLIFFVPVFVSFIQTGLVLKVPTLLFIILFWLGALLNFFCGILLSVLKKQDRQNFERYRIMLNMHK